MHHDVTLWALGASPETILVQHRRNTLYQRKPPKLRDDTVVKNMANLAGYKRCLGHEDHYLDFVHFFEDEIGNLGCPAVLQKYLVGDDEIANDMLPRMYMGKPDADQCPCCPTPTINSDDTGYVHSIMHVGIALEFRQPSIMAEGFAQAAIHHDYWYTSFLHEAEAEAQKALEPPLPLSGCIDACLVDPVIRNCSSIDYQRQFENGKFVLRKEMVKDGVVARAGKELGRVAARYRVDSNDLERATAELTNTASTVF